MISNSRFYKLHSGTHENAKYIPRSNLSTSMQMEWDGIPVRRSARLQIEEPSTAPPTVPSSESEEPSSPPHELPDLGIGVPIVHFPDIDTVFNGDYMT